MNELSREDVECYLTDRFPWFELDGSALATYNCPFDQKTPHAILFNLDTLHWKCSAGCGSGDMFAFFSKDMDVDYDTAKEGLIRSIEKIKEQNSEQRLPGLIHLHTVEPRNIEWVWPGYIAKGKLHILDGDPGLGKSLVTIDLAARVSAGRSMPDGAACQIGGAVLLTLEDGIDDTIVPRFELAGGDKTKVAVLQGVSDNNRTLRYPTVEDTDYISRACREMKASLLIIDPLMAHLSDSTDSHKDQKVRKALAPLAEMAEREGVAVIVVRHLNKGGSQNALHRGGGSIGIIGIARIGLLIAKDPENPDKRILAGTKSNIGLMPKSLTYHIEPVNDIPRIVWDGTSTHTADQLVNVNASPDDRSALQEEKDFLMEMLSSGPVNSNDIYKEAARAGIAKRSLDRAKKLLNVKSKKIAFNGGWTWELPKIAKKDEDCQEIIYSEKGNLGQKMATLSNFELTEADVEVL